MYQISQGNFFFEKIVLSPNFGFFQKFLALFDTFNARYNQSDIKIEFFGYFYPHKHFLKETFWKMN